MAMVEIGLAELFFLDFSFPISLTCLGSDKYRKYHEQPIEEVLFSHRESFPIELNKSTPEQQRATAYRKPKDCSFPFPARFLDLQ
jgi:hypothetical protein